MSGAPCTPQNAPPTEPGDVDFDNLAEGVFRFQVELLDWEGKSISGPSVPSRQVAAVVVSLAAIDDRAEKVAPEVDWPDTLPESDFV